MQQERRLRRAAKHGDVDAMVSLGNLLLRQDRDREALHYFVEAANRGNMEAFFRLGELAEEIGYTEKALHFYGLAYEGGYSKALFNSAKLRLSASKRAEVEPGLTRSDRDDALGEDGLPTLSLEAIRIVFKPEEH